MHKTTLLLLALLITFTSACGGTSPEGGDENTLTVFAAASLTDAFSELAEVFEAQHPGKRVSLNFAASNQLAQQLADGAEADIFASADRIQMDTAIETGCIEPEQVSAMVGNTLVIIFPPDNPAGIGNPLDLAFPGINLILAAAEVPVGRYSLEYLTKASDESFFGLNYMESVLDNVVSYEQSVRGVLTKVQLGEADAGIVYKSDVYGLGPEEINGITIPPALNVSATYFIAPINDSRQPELAQDFIDFVLSEEGQDILAKYGFLPVL